MKYIRTKEYKIIDLEKRYQQYLNNDERKQETKNRLKFYKQCHHNVLKKADTIEELCDEFVDIDNHDYYEIAHKNGITYALSKTKRFIGHCDIRLKYIGQIMGAIWTDKGLIYVAKMNDKGELELLWNTLEQKMEE